MEQPENSILYSKHEKKESIIKCLKKCQVLKYPFLVMLARKNHAKFQNTQCSVNIL
jgi:hypothetical protein